MPKYLKSFLFPDVNVWIALTYGAHEQHEAARTWFERLDMDARICFCRFTQISLLRLLTTSAVMGADEVMSQSEAWDTYDRWMGDGRILFIEEAPNVEVAFRDLTKQSQANPKSWADAYLAAFASAGGMRLVTFDRAFENKMQNVLLLKSG